MSIVSVDNIQPIGSGTSVTVNSAATLVLNNVNSTGVVTATSFVGNLTGTASANAVLSGSTNNTLVTVTGANAITGEANLTFDGTTLQVENSGSGLRNLLRLKNSNASAGVSGLYFNSTTSGTAFDAACVRNGVNGSGQGRLYLQTNNGSGLVTNLNIEYDGQVSIPTNSLNIIDSIVHIGDTNTKIRFPAADTISMETAGSERLRIDSNGYVTKPHQPVFIAYRVNTYNTTTSAAVLVYDNERIDVGGNYDESNGRFTAPVTGLYEFAYAAIAASTQTVYRYDLRVNGALPYNPLLLELRIDQNNQTAYGTNGEYVCYVNMTAGQYAQVYVHSDSAVNNVYGSSSYGYTYFRGRLIG